MCERMHQVGVGVYHGFLLRLLRDLTRLVRQDPRPPVPEFIFDDI